MADGLTVTRISGLEDLLRRLDRVPLALSRQVARSALTEAGAIIQAAAESSAASHRRTGELEEDVIMKVQISGDFRRNRVVVGPGYPGPGLKTRKRGRYAGQQDSTTSPGIYARFVESGHGMPGYSWSSRFGSAKQRRRTGRQIELGSHDVPPHPWLKPAFDASSDQAVQVLLDRTREAIQRIDQLVK
jgi:HK97 gp10 family phage protein